MNIVHEVDNNCVLVSLFAALNEILVKDMLRVARLPPIVVEGLLVLGIVSLVVLGSCWSHVMNVDRWRGLQLGNEFCVDSVVLGMKSAELLRSLVGCPLRIIHVGFDSQHIRPPLITVGIHLLSHIGRGIDWNWIDRSIVNLHAAIQSRLV